MVAMALWLGQTIGGAPGAPDVGLPTNGDWTTLPNLTANTGLVVVVGYFGRLFLRLGHDHLTRVEALFRENIAALGANNELLRCLKERGFEDRKKKEA